MLDFTGLVVSGIRRLGASNPEVFLRGFPEASTTKDLRSESHRCDVEDSEGTGAARCANWDFPKIWGTLFWGPYDKDPTILGYYIRVPYFQKPPNNTRRLAQLQNPER